MTSRRTIFYWRSRHLAMVVLACLPALFAPCNGLAQTPGPVARWPFDNASGPSVRDTVSGIEDKIGGFYKYVAGVSGQGLRFDGYTTSVVCKAEDSPKLRHSFSVTAWMALNVYPWNWVPIVDQEKDQQAGYFLGVDALGHLGLQADINGIWYSLTSNAQIPLKRWVQIAGVYDEDQGLAIYLDGKEVGRLAAHGRLLPADMMDLLIGRVRTPLPPFPSFASAPWYPIWYSLDGILDDVALYDRSLSLGEIQSMYDSAHAPTDEILPWPMLPSGPPGHGPFGAYYYTLKYDETWDRLRRVGPDSDVVVRFDDSPIRLVFWQGTSYIPSWVTESGTWFSDEFLEAPLKGCPDGGDCEPMSDKQVRYSHVSVLESSEARAIIHWRYALAEVEHYLGAHTDPLTGWFDWADEYWTIYPDGVAIREQVLHPTDPSVTYEWQETIVINPPGRRPDDDINFDALTIGNMKGETATYSWGPKASGVYGDLHLPPPIDKPENANIQWVNLKSNWKPFEIVAPGGTSFKIFSYQHSYYSFGCWNHWPISQIASSARICVAPDRASHSSLSHIIWDAYGTTENSVTKILMDGLTLKSATELVPLAKSWLSPPQTRVEGDAFASEGYDQVQRAFVVARKNANPAPLEIVFQASDASPLVDPAIVIKKWGDSKVHLRINGKPVSWGKDFRRGYVQKFDGNDLIVWIRQTSVTPLRIALMP